MSLIARALEATGLPTVVLGSALDILESGRLPRACFLDYPLGHSAGKPFDRADQERVVRAALANLESATVPGAIVHLPAAWEADPDWQAAGLGGTEDGDQRQPRDETPRYQSEADRLAAAAAD